MNTWRALTNRNLFKDLSNLKEKDSDSFYIYTILTSILLINILLNIFAPVIFTNNSTDITVPVAYTFIVIIGVFATILSILTEGTLPSKMCKYISIAFIIFSAISLFVFMKGSEIEGKINYYNYYMSTTPKLAVVYFIFVIIYFYLYQKENIKSNYNLFLYTKKYKLDARVLTPKAIHNIDRLTHKDIKNLPLDKELIGQSIALNKVIEESYSKDIPKNYRSELTQSIFRSAKYDIENLVVDNILNKLHERINKEQIFKDDFKKYEQQLLTSFSDMKNVINGKEEK